MPKVKTPIPVKENKRDWLMRQLDQVIKIEKWPKRLKKIGKSDRQFCLDNGIDTARFNRIKNFAVLAEPESMAEIEGALASEESAA